MPLCVSLCLCVLFFQAPLSSAEPLPVTRKIQNIDHSLANLDQEIATLQQKFHNQDLVLDSIHKEVSGLIQAVKESQSKSESGSTARLKVIEKNIERLAADLKQIKTHANESSTLFTQLQKCIKEQESQGQLHAEQIKDLESAIRSLASAIQVKLPKATSSQANQYQVKSGDTLEKIAKAHQTTIEALKAKNNLEKSTIFPGQTLQIR